MRIMSDTHDISLSMSDTNDTNYTNVHGDGKLFAANNAANNINDLDQKEEGACF